MLKININLSTRPFVNNRKFFLISSLLLLILVAVSYWNLSRYGTAHSRRDQVRHLLSQDQAMIGKLEREQQAIMTRLQ